jgi:transposase-like protein
MLTEKISIPALAKETGIAQWTLYRWRDLAKKNGEVVNKPKKSADKHSTAQKLAVVVETFALNEAELNEYCRTRGLYPAQVKAWREACEKANSASLDTTHAVREATRADKQQIKALERELHRKEKALAETAALLTLRKKAAAIWGEGEDA